MPRPSSDFRAGLRLVFVGRSAEINAFEDMLWPAATPRYQVLSLSGVGGQGKTSLLNQFAQRMTALDCRERPVCRLDFSIPQHRTAVEGLFFLRNQLRAQGVATHAFDVAFARHFALTRPGRELKVEYPELYRFPEDSLFGELVDIGAEAVREIPGGKLAVTLLARLSNNVAQWYTKRGVGILEQLDALPPQQLGAELALFLGSDLLEFVTTHPRRRPVLLLDTYEALWRDSGAATTMASASGDHWVRRLVEECPGCLWVMAGRHRLRWVQHDTDWAEYIVERELDALTSVEADSLLDAGAIVGAELRTALREVAAGHPLSLALGIRYCQMKAMDGAVVTGRDVPRTQQEVLDRFFDHLDPSVRGLMRVLAVPTLVPLELWPHLARSEFPVFDLYAASTVLEEVFFRAVSEREYSMHDRVREHLLHEMQRREPDLLRRARLAVFDFYDHAAVGGTTEVPDLSATVQQRDQCLIEASHHLIEAAPERYIRWCEHCLEPAPGVRGFKGSRQRRTLVDRANGLLTTIHERNLLDAATLARLRLGSDPWDAYGLELVDRLVIAIEGRELSPEVVASLRQIARDLMGANPARLPVAIVDALLNAGIEDVGLAITAGDLERATRWAEERVRNGSYAWFSLIAIARSSRADLCLAIGDSLAGMKQGLLFWVELARVVDTFCFESAPGLGLLVAQRSLRVSDSAGLVERLGSLEPSVSAHQAVLTVYLALQRSGEAECARQLIERRFGGRTRQAFSVGMDRLLSEGGDVGVLGSHSGQTFIHDFEQEQGMLGFVHGYLEAALNTDPDFAWSLSEPALAAIRAEITRSYEIYRLHGGRPSVATLRKQRVELLLNHSDELILFHNDALFLHRPVDWIAFGSDWRIIFGDAGLGQGRELGLIRRNDCQFDIGDGATLLIVLADEARGAPLEGEYKRFYGQAW